MIPQAATRQVKVSTMMSSAAFMRGFNEARKGIPMDYRAYESAQEYKNRWCYERGRQFGLVYSGAVKDGRRVRYDAVREYVFAMEKNWVR